MTSRPDPVPASDPAHTAEVLVDSAAPSARPRSGNEPAVTEDESGARIHKGRGEGSRSNATAPTVLNVEQSQLITKKSASNLALAFILLPRPKRDAMSALYAFCREVDDVADEESVPVDERRRQLEAWRQDIALACQAKGQPRFPVNRELQPVIQTYGLKFELLSELIRGCEMDLTITRYGTLAELEEYCYRVASVVGLLSIEIFGYHNPACQTYALHLGKALQLTNILRDVRNDAERGRIYLPQEELKRFGVTTEAILSNRYSDSYRRLASSLADRARAFYRQAAEVLPEEDRRSMIAAELMGSVYWRLWEKLERAEFNVFGPDPIRLNRPQKLALIVRTWFRSLIGSRRPNYG